MTIENLDVYQLRSLAEAAGGLEPGKVQAVVIKDGKWSFAKEQHAQGEQAERPGLQITGFPDYEQLPASIRHRGLRVVDKSPSPEATAAPAAAAATPASSPADAADCEDDDGEEEEITTDFLDCGRFDAFFWNWPAIEKFVLPYYIRLVGYQGLVGIVRKLRCPGVVGVLHGDYSPQKTVQARGYLRVRERDAGDAKKLFIAPL